MNGRMEGKKDARGMNGADGCISDAWILKAQGFQI